LHAFCVHGNGNWKFCNNIIPKSNPNHYVYFLLIKVDYNLQNLRCPSAPSQFNRVQTKWYCVADGCFSFKDERLMPTFLICCFYSIVLHMEMQYLLVYEVICVCISEDAFMKAPDESGINKGFSWKSYRMDCCIWQKVHRYIIKIFQNRIHPGASTTANKKCLAPTLVVSHP